MDHVNATIPIEGLSIKECKREVDGFLLCLKILMGRLLASLFHFLLLQNTLFLTFACTELRALLVLFCFVFLFFHLKCSATFLLLTFK